MDTKKVLEKLLKIAENQQKIILKLAQTQGLPPDSLPSGQATIGGGKEHQLGTDPPPGQLQPDAPTKVPSKLLFDTVEANPRLKGVLRHVNPPAGNEMQAIFNRGKLNQANWDAVRNTYQALLNQNKILTNYKLTYAESA